MLLLLLLLLAEEWMTDGFGIGEGG